MKFKLHLDLRLHYLPPMSEHGAGIVVTRGIEFPFVPTSGLLVYSRSFEDCPVPEGFTLKDVTWDIDRQVFLARTELISHDFPMQFIPDEIRAWLDRGWSFGSYRDAYPEPENDGRGDEAPDVAQSDEIETDEWDAAADLHRLTWQQRSAEQNRPLKALIRHMAETYDNDSAAYAFDKTGRFFSEKEVTDRKLDDQNIRKFMDAAMSFERMPFEEQQKWRVRTERYPSLEELAGGQT